MKLILAFFSGILIALGYLYFKEPAQDVKSKNPGQSNISLSSFSDLRDRDLTGKMIYRLFELRSQTITPEDGANTYFTSTFVFNGRIYTCRLYRETPSGTPVMQVSFLLKDSSVDMYDIDVDGLDSCTFAKMDSKTGITTVLKSNFNIDPPDKIEVDLREVYQACYFELMANLYGYVLTRDYSTEMAEGLTESKDSSLGLTLTLNKHDQKVFYFLKWKNTEGKLLYHRFAELMVHQ